MKVLCHAARRFIASKCEEAFIATKNVTRGQSRLASTILSQKSSVFQVYHIDPDGEVANYEVPKVTFYNELGLSARDLRFQHSHILCARNSKMIVRLQKMKAVICQNALLLIDTTLPSATSARQSFKEDERMQQFYETLPATLMENKLHTKHLPFEYRILEALLTFSVNSMSSELKELEPKISNLLETLTDPTNMDVDRSLVHILLQCNASLNKFSTIVKEYCQMLDDLLEYEEDLRDLCISVTPDDHVDSSSLYTAFVFTPSMNHGDDTEFHDSHMRNIKQPPKHTKFRINLLNEMELLLDSYLKEGEEIANKVAELKQAIEDSNSAILINLDSHRNTLIRLELQLTMGMFACTWACIIGVAFGMNLTSSLEENVPVFWAVTGFMYISAGIAWQLLLRMIKKRPGLSKKFGENGLKPPQISSPNGAQSEEGFNWKGRSSATTPPLKMFASLQRFFKT